MQNILNVKSGTSLKVIALKSTKFIQLFMENELNFLKQLESSAKKVKRSIHVLHFLLSIINLNHFLLFSNNFFLLFVNISFFAFFVNIFMLVSHLVTTLFEVEPFTFSVHTTFKFSVCSCLLIFLQK